MVRRTGLLGSLLGLGACFSEAGGGTADGAEDTSGAASTGADSASSGEADSSAGEASGTSSSTASTTAVDTTGPGSCTWPLDWSGTLVKDVVLVVHAEPLNLGALLSAANDAAAPEGAHLSVASACDPMLCGDCCGVPSEAYEHHTVEMFAADPLAAAAAVPVTEAFMRPDVHRRVVIVTDTDTGWGADMVAGEPLLATAQIDARVLGTCDATPVLDALVEASGGTKVCGDLMAPQILDDQLLRAQPACELFGDPGAAPDMVPSTLVLEAMTLPPEAAPISLMPDGPGVCANDPAQWTLIDPALGHVGLCPLACRDVAGWDPSTLGAVVEFGC